MTPLFTGVYKGEEPSEVSQEPPGSGYGGMGHFGGPRGGSKLTAGRMMESTGWTNGISQLVWKVQQQNLAGALW